MIYLGCDPDLHSTSLAALDDTGVVGVWCIKSRKKGLRDREAVLTMVNLIEHGLTDIFGELPGVVASAAVESQELYRGRGNADTKNPRSLLMLANISGALLLGIRGYYSLAHIELPAPQEWKGSVPKQIHQRRIFERRLGWACEGAGKSAKTGYCFPSNPSDYSALAGASSLLQGDWKHVADALGIALWVRDQHKRRAVA